MCVTEETKRMTKKNIMCLLYARLLLCHLQRALAQPTNAERMTFPPRGSFCFFTSSEFVFEAIITEIAPSAKLQGAGKLKNLYAYLPNPGYPVTVGDDCDPQTPLQLKNLWGVVYYIAQEDYSIIEQFAQKQISMISDVMVEVVRKDAKEENGQTMECQSMDAGLLPQAFPVPVHKKFCQEVCNTNYLDRLADVGVPQDYIASLTMLPTCSKNVPRLSTTDALSLTPFAVQQAQPTSISTTSNLYNPPANKYCVFAASELIFPDAMVRVAPSATLIGGGMLLDNYIGLGGNSQSDQFVKFEGFDHIWGATYEIDQTDLYPFLAYGQQFFFLADVKTELKSLGEATCKTFDVGLLPNAFPFAVFKEAKMDVQRYAKQLQELGAPANYVSTISSLASPVYLPDPTNKVGSWVY